MHAASGGGFFDVDPEEPTPEPAPIPQPAWSQAPAGELPGRVVIDEVLHRDAATAVVLSEARAYGTGLLVSVRWVHRRTTETVREWERWLMDGMRHPGGDDPDSLRVGLRLADGTRVLPIDLRRAWNTPDVEPPTLFLMGGGAGGRLDEYEGDLDAWLWAGAPVRGDLDVVVEWRALGVPETVHRIPGDLLTSAPAPRPLWE